MDSCVPVDLKAVDHMKKILPAIEHKDAYTRAAERLLQEYLDAVIFTPLDAMMEEAGLGKVQEKADRRENAGTSAIEQALRSGQVWYADGAFCGQFSAEISRELRAMGATHDSSAGTFAITQERIPLGLRFFLAEATQRSKDLHHDMDELLGQMQLNLDQAPAGLQMQRAIEKMMADLQGQFVKQVASVESVEVAQQLTPAIAKTLADELTNNLELDIKKWATSAIVDLRVRVQQNALAGYRADRLARQIAAERGVSQRKAEFLAEQETSLFVSKYREQRARDVGATSYKWSTSHDERVRPDHRVLNGKVFSFDNPPVTCQATGARNNPGEDFRCRCVAMPIIEL